MDWKWNWEELYFYKNSEIFEMILKPDSPTPKRQLTFICIRQYLDLLYGSKMYVHCLNISIYICIIAWKQCVKHFVNFLASIDQCLFNTALYVEIEVRCFILYVKCIPSMFIL